MPNPPAHEGLHVLRVDNITGALTHVASYIHGLNVGAITLDAKRGILYVSDEVDSTAEFRQQHGSAGGGGGRIYAFLIDSGSGELMEIGNWPSYGTQPAGIALDASGDFLVVSHFTSRTTTTAITGDPLSGYRIEPRYDDATTVLFPINPDGQLDSPSYIHVHPTSSSEPPSCLHSVTLSSDGSFLVECDMKKDQLITYGIDCDDQSLNLKDLHSTASGSGPRYSAFHPSLPVFYVNYEYQPTIEVFSYRKGGSFRSKGKVTALPDDMKRDPNVQVLLSDLRVHPSGQYVYTLIRGHNAVSAFAVDGRTGSLSRIQTVALDGLSPKGCSTSPDGKFLYVALSVSNEVQVWNIGDDGLLLPTGQTAAVPRPSAMAVIDLSKGFK